jgi:hypothetical protein
MSEKAGRGHKISPVNNKGTKLAYSYQYQPCPKIDSDYLGIIQQQQQLQHHQPPQTLPINPNGEANKYLILIF